MEEKIKLFKNYVKSANCSRVISFAKKDLCLLQINLICLLVYPYFS